jgi:hypothetical protein
VINVFERRLIILFVEKIGQKAFLIHH